MADNRWVTVFAGPMWQADFLRSLLESEGIPTYLPDNAAKTVDPFITGGNALAVRLQVPASALATAKTLIETRRGGGEGEGAEGDEAGFVWPEGAWPEGEGEDDGESDDEYDEYEGDDEDDMSPEEELEHLASRTRWWAVASILVMGVTTPLALLYGGFYLAACGAEGRTASNHRITVATVVLAVVALAGWIWVLLI